MSFPVDRLRLQFPAFQLGSVLFDNGAGTQVSTSVIEAMQRHLLFGNAIPGAPYAVSENVALMTACARAAAARFLNAPGDRGIAFGQSTTQLLDALARLVGQNLRARTRIIVTDFDHAANVKPWLNLDGVECLWWRSRSDGSLHVEDLAPLLDERVRVVAFSAASNATGARTDIAAVAKMAGLYGAATVCDCVHLAPHAMIDVDAWKVDHVVYSGHKIFGPHIAVLWSREAWLDGLAAHAGLPAGTTAGSLFEAGTPVFENIAGLHAALDYMAVVGNEEAPGNPASNPMGAISRYEEQLASAMESELLNAGCRIFGPGSYGATARIATFGFSIPKLSPARATRRLADLGFALRHGNMYSPRLMATMGLNEEEGLVRASLVHLNTFDEIARFGEALRSILP